MEAYFVSSEYFLFHLSEWRDAHKVKRYDSFIFSSITRLFYIDNFGLMIFLSLMIFDNFTRAWLFLSMPASARGL